MAHHSIEEYEQFVKKTGGFPRTLQAIQTLIIFNPVSLHNQYRDTGSETQRQRFDVLIDVMAKEILINIWKHLENLRVDKRWTELPLKPRFGNIIIEIGFMWILDKIRFGIFINNILINIPNLICDNPMEDRVLRTSIACQISSNINRKPVSGKAIMEPQNFVLGTRDIPFVNGLEQKKGLKKIFMPIMIEEGFASYDEFGLTLAKSSMKR